jgi:hypothetical protein
MANKAAFIIVGIACTPPLKGTVPRDVSFFFEGLIIFFCVCADGSLKSFSLPYTIFISFFERGNGRL